MWWVCPILWQQTQSFDMAMSHSCLIYFGYWFSPSPISSSLIRGAVKEGYCQALNNGFSNNLFFNHIMDLKLNTEDTPNYKIAGGSAAFHSMSFLIKYWIHAWQRINVFPSDSTKYQVTTKNQSKTYWGVLTENIGNKESLT